MKIEKKAKEMQIFIYVCTVLLWVLGITIFAMAVSDGRFQRYQHSTVVIVLATGYGVFTILFSIFATIFHHTEIVEWDKSFEWESIWEHQEFFKDRLFEVISVEKSRTLDSGDILLFSKNEKILITGAPERILKDWFDRDDANYAYISIRPIDHGWIVGFKPITWKGKKPE